MEGAYLAPPIYLLIVVVSSYLFRLGRFLVSVSLWSLGCIRFVVVVSSGHGRFVVVALSLCAHIPREGRGTVWVWGTQSSFGALTWQTPLTLEESPDRHPGCLATTCIRGDDTAWSHTDPHRFPHSRLGTGKVEWGWKWWMMRCVGSETIQT
ncbi:hypothetical protein BYT27DRAFT_7254825 [Phlegmacium glaucopus]|nr:hypothetical protein BYT27DRAFT_7254825 [Phlegmacium glaucopus]